MTEESLTFPCHPTPAILWSHMAPRGAYPADRAAALSGVPRSTVHDWARKGVLVPGISAERTRLWSYADLMGLRLVYWLRHPKQAPGGEDVPAAPMSQVREALDALRAREQDLWSPGGPSLVAVERGGRIVLNPGSAPEDLTGQWLLGDGDWLNLVVPFPTDEGTKGPDLIQPRPTLRIIPGKLGGEPHVARSRVETRALAALARRGMDANNIVALYPTLDEDSVVDAIDLEDQLERNLHPAVAA
jgi:uncharacterized protein (DUF433 family)